MSIKPPFLNLSNQEQKSALEVLLFASDEPLTLKYIFELLIVNSVDINQFDENNTEDDNNDKKQLSITQEIMNRFEISPDYFQELINEINADLLETNRPYLIVNIAGGFQFATLPEYGELMQRLTRSKTKRKFSQASLEVLAIIAYKQPVTKPEIEQIRGVNSNDIVNVLLERKLIKIAGRKDVLGKPLLYATTNLFLKTFGLKFLEDLPKLREIEDISTDDILPQTHLEVTLDVSDPLDAEAFQKVIDNDFSLNDEELESLIKNNESNDNIYINDINEQIIPESEIENLDDDNGNLIKVVDEFENQLEIIRDENIIENQDNENDWIDTNDNFIITLKEAEKNFKSQ